MYCTIVYEHIGIHDLLPKRVIKNLIEPTLKNTHQSNQSETFHSGKSREQKTKLSTSKSLRAKSFTERSLTPPFRGHFALINLK